MAEYPPFTELEVYCKATECGIGDKLYASVLIGDLQEAAEQSSYTLGYGTDFLTAMEARPMQTPSFVSEDEPVYHTRPPESKGKPEAHFFLPFPAGKWYNWQKPGDPGCRRKRRDG